MKKSILFFVLLFSNCTFGQQLNADSLVQMIVAEKNPDKKIELIILLYTAQINNDPTYSISIGTAFLKYIQKGKQDMDESSAYSLLGHGYRLLGNNIKALEYHHQAVALAEKCNNHSLLAIAENQIAHVYKDRLESDKAIQFYTSSLAHAEQSQNKELIQWPLVNLGSVYLTMNKLDSALIYSQRTFELMMQPGNASTSESSNFLGLLNLAGVHSKLNNAALASIYYNMAKDELPPKGQERYASMIYTGMAEHFKMLGQTDSADIYARRAIDVVNGSPFFYLSSRPAQLLIDKYQLSNCDSTLKYASIFKNANDSLSSRKADQQILLMTLDEDLRKQELASAKVKASEERKQNIQYVLIAFGIVALLSLFLLLSHSFITNVKWISFFGVVALLIVFEFFNLLLHPFLERITHHSPVLMLLGLVVIAALLVPLHHKAEKWATQKLIEKNKQIRLARARKTIAQLEQS